MRVSPIVLVLCALLTSTRSVAGGSSSAEFSKAQCDAYDDDGTFTEAVCGKTDNAICFTGTSVVLTPCNSTFWCRELCGAMCGDDAGALCFYQTLSNLETACDTVSAVLEAHGFDPGANETARLGGRRRRRLAGDGAAADGDDDDAAAAATPAALGAALGHGLDANMSDFGCGRHAYCEYCDGDCNSTRMGLWAAKRCDGGLNAIAEPSRRGDDIARPLGGDAPRAMMTTRVSHQECTPFHHESVAGDLARETIMQRRSPATMPQREKRNASDGGAPHATSLRGASRRHHPRRRQRADDDA